MKVSLRPKNRLTLPREIARLLGVQPGDQLILSVDEGEPGVVRIRPMPRGYAGIAKGGYGTSEEVAEYLRGERASWDE